MKTQTITIVSELGNDLQAWTFNISEADLLALMEKYQDKSCIKISKTYLFFKKYTNLEYCVSYIVIY